MRQQLQIENYYNLQLLCNCNINSLPNRIHHPVHVSPSMLQISRSITSTLTGSLGNVIKEVPILIQTQIRTATKKAGGSTNNGRDSAGRRLGVKVHHNGEIHAGSIIIRQRGKKFFPGENVGMGKDHTLFAKVDGKVAFSDHLVKRNKKVVNVVTVI